MENRRNQLRLRRLKDGRLSFHDRRSVVNCTVRDVSEQGARLLVGEAYLLPQRFEISITGGPPRTARRIWVRPNEMGIRFED